MMGTVHFDEMLASHGLAPIRRARPSVLQINLGKRCNQVCRHCHVNASPTRTESMSNQTVDRVIELLKASPTVTTVDITGGAPELNPDFRRLVAAAHRAGRHVMDRCNLTILEEPGQEDTAHFLSAHEVEVIASLPCYGSENVDAQRGQGVFEKSIRALRLLNSLGYGDPDGRRALHLVYNPLGASLPPAQESLEQAYKERLQSDHGIVFNRLYTLTNMPIARFASDLQRKGQLEGYMDLLASGFNPAAVDGLMCLNTVSVDWTGRLYDCDFNQMLAMPAGNSEKTIWDIDDLSKLKADPIATAPHCLGCTAGAGSSCGGALL